MSRRFEGRGVVVTGGAGGIGLAIVDVFVREGARVLSVDLRDTKGADSLIADLADVAAVKGVIPEAVARLGRVDVLVNNAGVQPDGSALDVTADEFDRTFAVNARAPFLLMQDACRHFLSREGGGSIVNVASANALRNESPEAPYNASKAALVALTKAFAHEFGHLGIRVNAVCPGETVTPEEEVEMTDEDRHTLREYLQRVPMRRPARPGEQAAAVLFLASEDASFITGESLLVDGGELAGNWYDSRLAPPVPDR